MLIIFEGVDGSGKTFTIRQIQKKVSQKANNNFIFLKEPMLLEEDGINITDFLLNYNLDSLSEFYFFMGIRVLGYYKNLLPALAKNKIVIFDRYFYSTLVYQSINTDKKENLSINFLNNIIINTIEKLHVSKETKNKILNPDIIFIFIASYESGIFRKRIQNEVNKFEKRGFEYYEQINQNYINLFNKLKEKNQSKVYLINSNQNIENIIDYCYDVIIKHTSSKCGAKK
ncbi:dTMP kinase [Mycoplasma sp. SG1]|uniref:dTMP kinase n=1 Tax=Mycoplasma sp. SG1 TaxID=2810348 RepID=UPI0020246577|nr:hypothetical protein [Mycoplasma sp. SG1]URM52849.1 hypothetical protein JRW51_00690 [Mycoplasma sp. SG1]